MVKGRVHSLGFRFQGLGFKVYGLGICWLKRKGVALFADIQKEVALKAMPRPQKYVKS